MQGKEIRTPSSVSLEDSPTYSYQIFLRTDVTNFRCRTKGLSLLKVLGIYDRRWTQTFPLRLLNFLQSLLDFLFLGFGFSTHRWDTFRYNPSPLRDSLMRLSVFQHIRGHILVGRCSEFSYSPTPVSVLSRFLFHIDCRFPSEEECPSRYVQIEPLPIGFVWWFLYCGWHH